MKIPYACKSTYKRTVHQYFTVLFLSCIIMYHKYRNTYRYIEKNRCLKPKTTDYTLVLLARMLTKSVYNWLNQFVTTSCSPMDPSQVRKQCIVVPRYIVVVHHLNCFEFLYSHPRGASQVLLKTKINKPGVKKFPKIGQDVFDS